MLKAMAPWCGSGATLAGCRLVSTARSWASSISQILSPDWVGGQSSGRAITLRCWWASLLGQGPVVATYGPPLHGLSLVRGLGQSFGRGRHRPPAHHQSAGRNTAPHAKQLWCAELLAKHE